MIGGKIHMKQKYTLTIANSEISIVTEESKENIDAIVGIVDRKIREIYLHSKGECSRTNAAILVCLDYCAEKLEMQKTLKNLNAEIERLTVLNEAAEREKAALEREIEALKAISASLPKTSPKKANDEQIRLDEIAEVEVPVEEATVTVDETSVAEAPEVAESIEEAPTADKPTVKLKKKKVRAMFDAISFDDI